MPASRPGYRLTLGSTRIESESVSRDPPLAALATDADLATPAAELAVRLGHSAELAVEVGDPASLELTSDSSFTTVFTGTVDRVEPGLEELRVVALGEEAKLLALRLNQVYESRSAGQIVSDLAGQAGVTTGTVEDGLDLPFYAVDAARSAYGHCRDLAERAGFDLWADPEGELQFAAFSKAAADHLFTYARDVLALAVAALPQSFERVEVWGESPASSEGTDAASWLVRDFSDSKGTAGSGALLRISDPAIRTKDAADASARGRLDVLARRATFGTAVVLGSAEVALGAAVGFRDAPDDRLGGVFQVRRVSHRFDKRAGFTTRLELCSGGSGGLP